MAEIRCISRNFNLRKETYNKLSILAEERGFKDLSVFVTKKVIVPLYRRIDMDRFLKGKIAREPIPRKIVYSKCEEKTMMVHTRLTKSESQWLDDVLKYHNFIDEKGKPEYSKFLACWIVNKWDERDEEEEKPSAPAQRPRDIRSLSTEDYL